MSWYTLLSLVKTRRNPGSVQTGPYIAGGQLPPPGKLIGVKTKRPTRNPVCIREIPVKVCGVCPRRQKILGTALPNVVLLPCRIQMNLTRQWHGKRTAAVSKRRIQFSPAEDRKKCALLNTKRFGPKSCYCRAVLRSH